MTTKSKGFTLIEIIIAILLVGILFAIGTNFMVFLVETYLISKSRNIMGSDQQLMLARFTRDLRRVRNELSFISANPNSLSFVNQDGDIIAYDLGGSFIRRGVNGTYNNLAGNATSLNITYRDDYNNLLSTIQVGSTIPTNIRLVQANVSFEAAEGKARPFPARYKVHPRNVASVRYLFW